MTSPFFFPDEEGDIDPWISKFDKVPVSYPAIEQITNYAFRWIFLISLVIFCAANNCDKITTPNVRYEGGMFARVREGCNMVVATLWNVDCAAIPNASSCCWYIHNRVARDGWNFEWYSEPSLWRYSTFMCREIKQRPCRHRINADRIMVVEIRAKSLHPGHIVLFEIPPRMRASTTMYTFNFRNERWLATSDENLPATCSRIFINFLTPVSSFPPLRSPWLLALFNSASSIATRSLMPLTVTDIETALSITHNTFPEQTGCNVRSKCGLHSHKYSRGAS